MGRLTLNVLLSFAQFEREVTGERIRDKIAASKKKGMWMGGFVPLGYDLRDRKIYVNPKEAEIVRAIYSNYLRLGCVMVLKDYLDRSRIFSKSRTSGNGTKTGGTSFSRGALYKILKNRIYSGEIAHKGGVYIGQHDAIINREQWDQVQKLLHQEPPGQASQGARYKSESVHRHPLRCGGQPLYTDPQQQIRPSLPVLHISGCHSEGRSNRPAGANPCSRPRSRSH